MDTEQKPVARVSFSSEHEGALYYDEDGNRIAVGLEEPAPYKPQYDFETSNVKHWWFKNESELFFDIHTPIAKFRSRTAFGKYWKAFRKTLMHKYLWRHL